MRMLEDPARKAAFAEVSPVLPRLFRLPDAWIRTAAETVLQCRETGVTHSWNCRDTSVA